MGVHFVGGKYGDILKEKNPVEVLSGMAALCGLFLPYTRELSFFQSLSGAAYGCFAPVLTLSIALATVLYALGLTQVPCVMSLTLLVICTAFPCYACWTAGAWAVLSLLQPGAWVLFTGLLLMALSPPLFSRDR